MNSILLKGKLGLETRQKLEKTRVYAQKHRLKMSFKNYISVLLPLPPPSFFSFLLCLLCPATLCVPYLLLLPLSLLSSSPFHHSAVRTAFLPPPFSCSFTLSLLPSSSYSIFSLFFIPHPPPFSCSFYKIPSPLFFLFHLKPFFHLSSSPFHIYLNFLDHLPFFFSPHLTFTFYLLFFVYFDFFSVLSSKFSSLSF
jgi:hypothetical protein